MHIVKNIIMIYAIIFISFINDSLSGGFISKKSKINNQSCMVHEYL